MSFQETTSTSWFGRIKNSVIGILVGVVLLVAMVVLLFWNEGRAVTTHRSLTEGAGLVVTVDAGRIDPANDRKLVHISGQVATNDKPSDPEFGITVNALRLERNVEMYQWVESRKSETKTKLGGGEETVTTYSYAMEWSDQEHNSSEFRDASGRSNPPMQVRRASFQVDEASIGAFELSQRIIGMIDNAKPLPIGRENVEAIQSVVGAGMRVHAVDGRIYLGSNPSEPRVGDYRIAYEVVPVGPASVVGAQSGSGFAPYQTQAGNQLLMAEAGVVPADQMFADAIASNNFITWIVRLVGVIFLIVGFAMLMAPLGVLADVIPFVGSIVRMGTGIIASVLGILLGTVTIAIAWFWYRPLTALIILAVGFALAYGVSRLGKKKAAPVAPPAAA